MRLTVAQALVRFLANQYSERDGVRQRLIPGCFGIFGHGNVAGVGQALAEATAADPALMPYHQARNEQAMVHQAVAFARMRRRRATLAATASVGPPFRYGPAEDVPIELRGAGLASRQVNNFAAPQAFEADRIIAVEVLTPDGCWSSYPPHKHDVDDGEREIALEEIYYFEVQAGPDGPGFGYQRVYGSGQGREIDVLQEVRQGDTILVPHGYHGPSMAAPGYHLYYLNVMAGAGEERAWRFSDDPEHAWIRATWESLEIDPRLPLTTAEVQA